MSDGASTSRERELEELRRRVAEAEQTLRAMFSGQIDSVAHEAGVAPVLLLNAQKELRDSQRRFAAIFESSADAILLFDDAGRYLEANPAACALFATPREKLVGTHMGQFLPDIELAEQHLSAIRENGELSGEMEVVTAKGERPTIAYRAMANILPGIHMSMLRDVTEAKTAHAAQVRLATLVESSPDAIMRVSLDGTIEDWNPAAERLYGYLEAEAIGRRMDFLELPDRRGEEAELQRRVLAGETILELETVRRRKDGVNVDVLLSMSPIRDADGSIVACSKIIRDISDRKRAEQRFRGLLESAPDALLLVDSSGIITLVNRQLEALFGYARHELMGASIDLLVPDQVRARHADHWRSYMLAPSARLMGAGRELKARRRGGVEFDAEITLSPLRDENGELNVIAAVRDVTERNRMRDQLIFSDRMACIGTLAAGVAHEINNPLASIMANVSLALEQLEGMSSAFGELNDLADELKDARDAAERVRLLVRDLKIFSRSEDEKLGSVDVRRVMESTLRMAWNEIRHRARVVKDYGRMPQVRANDSRLGQVFLNVLVNAAQAIPEGRAHINEIRVATGVGPDGRVVVTIADTGVGMAPEVVRRLFTPFFTTKPVGQGTGLGLSICRRLVTSFGGAIEVDSTVGVGTVVRIALPAADGMEAAPERPRSAPPAERRGHVLVVDDEAMVAKALRRALGAEHEVTTLSSAEEALKRIMAGERFDVILCDLMMPQMTGMELHAELMCVAPEEAARMIFVTGGAFTPGARDFLDHSANLRVEKPFDMQHLRTLVNEKIR